MTDLSDTEHAQRSTAPPPGRDMVWIPGGRFRMGSSRHYPEERPERTAEVDGFWMDLHPVTNRDFAAFVADTGWQTLAELPPDPADYPGALPEMLHPASLVFTPSRGPVDLSNHYNWWRLVPGAEWRRPEGPDSSIDGLEDHPVVHVAWRDVEAYAQWAGLELPTEAEWERAARGGLHAKEFAWGDELAPNGVHMANTWQGRFPYENTLEDGWPRTSPVMTYPPNGFGLYDMIGNVWEWTTDWWSVDPARRASREASPCCGAKSRVEGREEESCDPAQPSIRIPRKVLKGGSHLCAPCYCRRYRPAARHAQPIDTSTSHVGFRCVLRPKGAA